MKVTVAKSHLTMLAHPYKPVKHGIGGWFASEKLDGQRCLWIPGTRGLWKDEVPFANLAKDGRYVNRQRCSGLWSRYGNVIHAPEEWLDDLPAILLDGELWLRRGRGGRQELSKIIKKLIPDEDDWSQVRYHCFDIPSVEMLLGDRYINLTNFEKRLHKCVQWWEGLDVELLYASKSSTPFESKVILLERHLGKSIIAKALKQVRLSFNTHTAQDEIKQMVNLISGLGGEGLIIRAPNSLWIPERCHTIVKVKKLHDDEATVTGYTTGRETDKGSKLLGLMGALVVNYMGNRLELSGFTDAERRFKDLEARQWAIENPGEEVPDWIESAAFPRGSVITFQYRDLTTIGIPNEARYWRKHEVL